MIELIKKEFLKKIVLGTAQLGMNYGITNRDGQPKESESFDILSKAVKNGIRLFDTAPDYGCEKLIGNFIKKNDMGNSVLVLTKIPPLSDYSNYSKIIEESLNKSINNLGVGINVLFFHNANDSQLLLRNPSFFQCLLEKYPVTKLGVSVYDPKDLNEFRKSELDLAIQFPLNILDRRFENVKMKDCWTRYARSIFLQGLLSSSLPLIKKAPQGLVKLKNEYHNFLEKNQIDPIKYALSFIEKNENCDYCLIGVDNIIQLDQIINTCKQIINCEYTLQVPDYLLNSKWIDPRKWS